MGFDRGKILDQKRKKREDHLRKINPPQKGRADGSFVDKTPRRWRWETRSWRVEGTPTKNILGGRRSDKNVGGRGEKIRKLSLADRSTTLTTGGISVTEVLIRLRAWPKK